MAYEQFLIVCDRTAAHLLGDEHTAARAADLRRHTASVRGRLAREQHTRSRRGDRRSLPPLPTPPAATTELQLAPSR